MKTLSAFAILTLTLTGCTLESTDEPVAAQVQEEETEQEQVAAPEPVEEETKPPLPSPPPPPPPAPEPEPESEPMFYGDDPYLDSLYDECEAGNADTCSDLFWESPVDSEYEAFGMEHMDDNDAVSEDFEQLIFQLVWDDLSLSEKDDICFGIMVDPDEMYQIFIEGHGGSDVPDRAAFNQFFNGVC